ncbi:MAG: FTR1 family protein [Actinobacteria bacterium]|nr:FTR1 family protein [Actinomycetota bacterium]
MFPNFLIGLREGLEASLVVGILVAYLVRTGHRDKLGPVWAGIAVAIAASLAVGAALTFTSNSLSFKAQETFGGVMSIIAVGFVTAMVFWMRSQARALKNDLQGKLDAALTGGGVALFVVALFAVGREGLETALFLWTSIEATEKTTSPIIGAAIGLGVAVVVGWLIYRQSVRLNLATFFTVTGAGLVIVAAGVLAYGVHDLQEASILPGLNSLAFDVSSTIPPSSWYGTLLKGIFNFSPASTWLEVAAYLAYLVPVMFLFFRRPTALSPTTRSTPLKVRSA